MRWRDGYCWTSIDTDDSIVITVVRDRGKLGSIVGAAVIGLILVLGFAQKSWVWLIFGSIGLASTIFDRLRGDTTQLTVTTKEFVVRGHVARNFDDHIQIDATGLRSLEYFGGGEDESSGLYAYSAFSKSCILPGLNREQAAEIAILVRERFPHLEDRDISRGKLLFEDIAGTLLYGNKEELTSLNLSKPEE